ncbi:GNAT family N-acetyltransferase [Microtetraspora fusca]|uniref:GNAT family N-acetyltransferase n=1 Tax=Microtetraspora fusca TaxID=1997 RepID=UPI0008326FE4|nr:GNAT family N-acetyltransferase [Microtetraspora fusca]
MTQFRTARAADDDSLYEVWARSFTASHIVPLYEQDPGRRERTYVATDGDGVLAVVYWLPRDIRDASGAVRRVGCVSSVATRPEARGRGLVKRLLALAADAMTADGCAWSLLFTGTPQVYASSGWQVFDRPFVAGPPAAGGLLEDGWAAAPVGLDRWLDLARLHDRYDERRPLTTVRSPRDWTERVPLWYAPPCEILLLRRHDAPMAYAVVDWSEGEVLEVALGAEDAAVPLFHAVAGRARTRGLPSLKLYAPLDPAIRAALPSLFDGWAADGDPTGMARPILADPAEVRTVVEDPRAVAWTADYF